MTVEHARRLLLGWIDVVAYWTPDCTPYLCRGCMSLELACEAASLALDMAVAEAIRGPGPRPASRLQAVDLALKEGIAFA